MQKFKIGRIGYNLPGKIRMDGFELSLRFTFGEARYDKWEVCYFGYDFDKDEITVLTQYTDTFNQAIKAMHKALKDVEYGVVDPLI